MRSRKKKGLQGFTLIELLVVIGIIAVLVALLVPTITNARKRSAAQAAYNVLVRNCEAYKNTLVAGGAAAVPTADYSGLPSSGFSFAASGTSGYQLTGANYANIAVGNTTFGSSGIITCDVKGADASAAITYTPS